MKEVTIADDLVDGVLLLLGLVSKCDPDELSAVEQHLFPLPKGAH